MRHSFLLLLSFCVFFQTHAQDKAGNLSGGESTEVNVNDSVGVLMYANEMPSFQGGGDQAFVEYIKERLIYPKDARALGIQGSVFVQYIIEKDGTVSNVSIIPGKGVHPSLDQAAIDVIASSPKWSPGLNNGNPVRIRRIQRITFTLSQGKK